MSREPQLVDRLGTFHHFYYVPEIDQVGPCKFIGYKDLDGPTYVASSDSLWGGRAERLLTRWFEQIPPDSPEYIFVREKVERLVERFGKWPRKGARMHVPRGWRLNRFSPDLCERGSTFQASTVARVSGDGHSLRRAILATVRQSDGYFVAECADLPVVTQGRTLDETAANLREAVGLHIEDEDLYELGFVANPVILFTMELEPTLA